MDARGRTKGQTTLSDKKAMMALDCSPKYSKFRNFRKNFLFENSVKRHICDVKYSLLRHVLPISVNDRVSSSFREGFLGETSHVRCFAKLKLSRKFQILHYLALEALLLNRIKSFEQLWKRAI